ncbi:MAG: glycosyltransferase [Armatimonadota bacterium]
MSKQRNICFWGTFYDDYPRNYMFINGLKSLECNVSVCRTDIRGLYKSYDFLAKYKLNIKPFMILNFVLIFLARLFIYLSLSVDFMVRHRDCDIIITGCEYEEDVLWASFLARIFGKKLIFNALNSNYETSVIDRGKVSTSSFLGKYILKTDKKSFNVPDIIIVDTEEHKKYFSSIFDSDINKFKVIYVGADEKIFNLDYNCGEDKDIFTAVFYGIYTPLHGVKYIIEAANVLKDEGIKFKIIGDGQDKEKALAKAKEFGLKNIDFIDYLSQNKVTEELENSDIGLGIFGGTDKSYRVIPHKVFQMMMAGLPVITADSPAVREVFKDGESCVLCSMADAASLANKIKLLKEDRKLRKNISKNAKELVKSNFNTGSISSRLYDIIKEIV